MEQKVFRRPAVAGELEKFVEARLHTDGKTNIEEIKRLQEELTGSAANPYYVTQDPETDRILGRFEGATLADDTPFINFLKNSVSAARDEQAKLDPTPDR